MTTEIQTTGSRDLARVAESLVTKGDLSGLTPEERARHYIATCESHGLNPHSQPFSFLTLNGKLVMYANRGCTDQLAAMHHVNRKIIDGPRLMDLGGTKIIYCMAEASLPNGRTETAIATVPMTDPVMVLMKAETKAKRRATLSILGLGMLDETEAESIPGAVRIDAPRLDVRDDAPAQLAAPDALAALRADLDAAEGLTLDGARGVYARHDLGGTSLAAVTVAIVGALATRGYRLTATEAGQLLRGELPEALALAYDRLAAVDRHVDDEDGDAVVASVVLVLRGCGALAKPAKARLLKVGAQTIAALLGVDDATAAARLDAALRPTPTTPTTPTGTDAPRSTPTDATGRAAAPSATAGAQASASDGPRLVLDADETEARYLRADATGDAAWRERMVAYGATFPMAGAYWKRHDAFRAAGVEAVRYAATLAAIEAHEGRGPEAARQALDGYRTRRVMPQGVGEVIRLRTHRQIVAARTGTDG